MRSKQLEKESDVMRHIADASEAIRRKHKELKLGKDAAQRTMSEVLKPVITPLQKLVDNTDLHGNKKKLKDKKKTLAIAPWDDNRDSDRFFNSSGFDMTHTLQNIAASTPGHDSTLKEENLLSGQLPRSLESLSSTADASLYASMDDSVLSQNVYDVNDRIQYYLQILGTANAKDLDTEYGVRKLKDGFKLGNAPVDFKNEMMTILDKTYKLTPGLASLIFEKGPYTSQPTESDQNIYRSIILATNAHRKHYNPLHEIRRSDSEKYKNVIKPFVLSSEYKKTGSALLPQYMIAPQSISKEIDYIYWDNPNELVERLRLLMASQAAGNTSHTNEIFSIIEELREAGIVY